ncbi:MAG TPA: cadherin-like beta sandwich domain-containing protein [Spirochaetota bacterium]|nr:cadherin-like beta sandwich domain-containing protein [Spirochaetota bacterium]HOD15618.1 cadherin-like beta sandwich domain-containing protein [Spirochaetota bacterium]HPN13622.1 cadherin-like beta sandwich domain-containing protein [Spirochaetota bacterium]
MRFIKKTTGLLLIFSMSIILNSCQIAESGLQFLTNTGYSGNISNTDLKVLEVASYESTTGTTKTLSLTPAFSPNTYNYNVSIDPLVTDVTVVAVAEDERSVVAINTTEGTSRSIPVSEDSALVQVEITAPDTVTTQIYQINITRSVGLEESRLLNFEFFNEDNEAILLSPGFDPDSSSYKLHVAWNSYYVKVRATSISPSATIKIDGKKVVSAEKDLVILSSIPVGDTKTTQTITVTSTASNGDVSTYTFTAMRISAPVVSGDSAYLSSMKVTMGNNESVRQLYQVANTDFFYVDKKGFDKTFSDYSCVVFGFSTVKLTITPEDPSVSSLTVDSVEMKDSILDGKLVLDVTWAADDYSVKTIAIHVTSKEGGNEMDYSVKLRLLNIYEFYYGLYGPVGRANKASWGAAGTPNWSKTFNGSISGTMVWNITWVTTLSTVRNQMTYTNYNNGDQGFVFVGDNGGFKLNGVMSVIVNTSGTQTDGPQTGDIIMQTPEGDAVAIQHIHLRIQSKDAVSRNATSYTTVDYLGQTGVILYYDSNPYHKSLADGWDPDVPWTANDFWHP